MPHLDSVRFIEAVMLTNLAGNASDAGLHTMCVDGERVKLLGDMHNMFDGKLVVREPGVQLRQRILDEHAKSGQLCFVVTGASGIGLSSFAVYFAAMLLRRGERVLFQRENDYGVLLEPSTGDQPASAKLFVCPASNLAWRGLLNSRDGVGWYVMDSNADSCPPLYSLLPALLVTSAQRTMYRRWLKYAQMHPYFMPLPTDDEFFRLRDATESGLTDEQIFERIRYFGRSFREVFWRNRADKELSSAMQSILAGVPWRTAREDLLMAPAWGGFLESSVVYVSAERTPDGGYDYDQPEYFISSTEMRNALVTRALVWDGAPKVWADLQKHITWRNEHGEKYGGTWVSDSFFEEASRQVLVAVRRGFSVAVRPEFSVAVSRWDPNGELQPAQSVPSPFAGATLEPFGGRELPDAGSFLPDEKVLFYPMWENFPVLDAFGTSGDGTTFYVFQFTTDVTARRKLTGEGSQAQNILDQVVKLAAEKGLRLLFVLVVPQGAASSSLRPHIVPDGIDASAEVWEIHTPPPPSDDSLKEPEVLW